MLCLNIGGIKSSKCQFYKPNSEFNWKIVDKSKKSDYIYNIKSLKEMPFENNSVDYIFCSHILEHLYPNEIVFVLKEIYRVLKPTGIFRVTVPDFRLAMSIYICDKKQLIDLDYPDKPKNLPPLGMAHLTCWIYDFTRKSVGHKIGFDREYLSYFLRTVGFHSIRDCKFDECSVPFEGLEDPLNKGWCIHFECVK